MESLLVVVTAADEFFRKVWTLPPNNVSSIVVLYDSRYDSIRLCSLALFPPPKCRISLFHSAGSADS